ncbi:hypothetical protein KY284_010186 [Solanum tuberosum]|nr:hypothetical protein KY284_010186 [Solanum tuberosum]
MQNYGGSRRSQVNNVNFSENNAPESASFPTVPTFTADQYNHLLKMIDKDSLPQNHVANMAGNDATPWIVDTGATDHMDLCTGKVRGIGKEEGVIYMLPPTK